MSMYSEILEQPTIIERLVNDQWSVIDEIAKKINTQNISNIMMAGRGTSDNVCRYATYLWGSKNKRIVTLAAPSLFSLYHEPPILNNSVVFGVSQSGQSPDIVSVLEESHRQGALTIAITNNLSSPLSKSADFSIDILAGEEKAIAATKTYTAQLVIIAMISSALTRERESRLEMNKLSEWINKIILQEKCIQEIAYNYKGIEKCVVLGRGYNYASAFEWALKLKELSFISSEAYSSADFQHGPIAVLDNDYPVFVIAPEGKVLPSLYETVKNIQLRLSPKVLTISNNSNMLSISSDRISIPYDIPEWLSPIPAIIAGQLFTYHLTCSKNLDPNNPRLLKKVTETE